MLVGGQAGEAGAVAGREHDGPGALQCLHAVSPQDGRRRCVTPLPFQVWPRAARVSQCEKSGARRVAASGGSQPAWVDAWLR
jgi:hypothetical protein